MRKMKAGRLVGDDNWRRSQLVGGMEVEVVTCKCREDKCNAGYYQHYLSKSGEAVNEGTTNQAGAANTTVPDQQTADLSSTVGHMKLDGSRRGLQG